MMFFHRLIHRPYQIARQFGRGKLFSGLMAASYLLFGRTPSYRIYDWGKK